MSKEDVGLIDVERRELIELAQFVLNRSTENVREELHEYLVEIALYNTDRGATASEIKSLIEKEFSFSDFPISLIDSALARMGKRLTSRGTPPVYFLESTRRKELAEMFKHQRLLRSYFVARILTKISKGYGEISNVASSEIIQNLFKFLGVVFNNLSIDLARMISKVPIEVKGRIELLDTSEALQKTFESFDDKILANISVQVIKDTIEEYDEKTALFLYSLAQSYALLQILNIDPACQALQKKLILSDMAVFLDTNIAINLLCEHARSAIHESCVRIVKLMDQLGIKYFITRRTCKEIERHLQTSDEEYRNMGTIPEHRKKKLLRYVQDEVIREYWIRTQSETGLKWSAFIERLRRFTSILKKKYLVVTDNTVYDHIYSLPKFDQVSKMMAEASPEKHPKLVEHDCFHLLLVDHLRDQMGTDGIVPKRWFVTRDKSLAVTEKVWIVTEKRRPASVPIDVWLQMIAPLLSPKTAAKEASQIFSMCFSSDIIPSFPRIKPTLLAKLIGPCLDHRDLEIGEIMEITGDTYLREHFEEMDEKGQLEGYLTKKYIQITEKKYQTSIRQFEKEVTKLRGKLETSEKEKKSLREAIEVGKYFGKYVVGGLVFLVVWIVTYIWILLPTIKESYIACILAILISLIFGYLLGFKRYEWILEKLLKHLPSK